jgi:2-polyprenyl-3-methyl-5-hydroxy-6-metoxy-1,4-benzoquinol methylase
VKRLQDDAPTYLRKSFTWAAVGFAILLTATVSIPWIQKWTSPNLADYVAASVDRHLLSAFEAPAVLPDAITNLNKRLDELSEKIQGLQAGRQTKKSSSLVFLSVAKMAGDEDWQGKVLLPSEEYDLAAGLYDKWPWQKFWRHNEAPFVLSMVGEERNSQKILDVGTGTGYYIDQLLRDGADAVGLDVSEGMLRQAHKRLGPDARLIRADARDLPFRQGVFDAVLALRVLSHIEDISRGLHEIHRVLRAFGTLIISDVDPAHDYEVTRVPTVFGKVKVTTVKHSSEKLVGTADAAGFN